MRRAGSSLRVTAQLIDADTDSHVWAEKYSGTIEDVFAIQEEISHKIVKALQVKLTDSEARAVAERPIDNAAAYDCYLQAHHEMFLFTPAALDRAQKLADAGLALIGENPLLLATRGLVSWYYVNFSIRPEERYLDEAASFAARALASGSRRLSRSSSCAAWSPPNAATSRAPFGTCAGPTNSNRAMPPCSWSLPVTSSARVRSRPSWPGPWAKACCMWIILNPLNWVQRAWRHFGAGRLAEAEQLTRRAIELADAGNPVRAYAAVTLAFLGRRDEAIALFEQVALTQGNSPYGSFSAFFARALQGDADGAVGHVTPLLEQSARWVEYLAWFLADGYALIGHRDDAIAWLRKAVDRGFINYPFLSTHDPFLESLRGDADYQALMQVVQRRWQAFEV